MMKANLTCLRCNHTWLRRTAKLPVFCPACHSAGWRTEASARVLKIRATKAAKQSRRIFERIESGALKIT